MIPRDDVLTIPDKPSYFEVEVPGREIHHFRLPPLSVQFQVIGLGFAGQDSGDMAAVLDAACAAVGASWFNRIKALETPFAPGGDDEQLRAFSREVQMELTDEGYTVGEILFLGKAVMAKVQSKITEAKEARQRAGFSEPQPDGTSTP